MAVWLLLVAATIVPGVVAAPAVAAGPELHGLSIADLGLGMPKEKVTFEPGWSIGAGAVILHRSASPSLALAESPAPESTELLGSSDLALGFATGPIVTLARHISEATSAEVEYFGINGWQDGASVALAGGITTALFDAGSTPLDRVDASYRSNIDNIEVNAEHNFFAKIRWLVGARWIQLDESAEVLWDGRSTGSDYCSVSTRASNGLYGMQVGLTGTVWQPSERLHLDGHLKAGALANHMSSSREVEGTFNTIGPASRGVDRTSFTGDLALLAVLDLTERFSLMAGYQLLWIDGVATGFSPLGTEDVDTAFYHGLRLSAELNW
ncbi:MAG: hypothetical protein ACYC6Y_12545 [Thermoguttaceae bacterium]